MNQKFPTHPQGPIYDKPESIILYLYIQFSKEQKFQRRDRKGRTYLFSKEMRMVGSNNNIYTITLQKAKVKKNFQNLFSSLKFPEINNVFQSIVFISNSLEHSFIVFNNIIDLFNLLFQNNHISVAINYCFKFGLVYS